MSAGSLGDLESLELELRMVVNHLVGAGHETQVFWKSIK